ncbi:hypothetical protein ACO2Q8_18140 [Larkinella sp. VNQ87]|uniref:hypothetical protein n=1 Tax=Larkinella sp. VNQ87 TaxID=3400921 RepID=UPI003C03DB4D
MKRPVRPVLFWFSGIVCSFVILFFSYYVTVYSVNFPFQDDNSLLLALFELKKNLGWRHDLHTFFRAENDHRIFLPRLVGYLDYTLNGYLNFKTYILIGVVNLVLITGFVYRLFRQTNLPFYYFLPIPLFIFQPQYHEVTIWALTGLQHLSLLLMLCFCLTLLQKPSSAFRFGVALLLAGLATFTHGNGILVFATGGFLLLVDRHYKSLGIWIAAMLIALACYLYGYRPGSGVERTLNFLTIPGTFLAKIGAIFSAWPAVAIPGSVLWGSLIAVLVIPVMVGRVWLSFQPRKAQPAVSNQLLAYFCFIFLTISLITIFRSSDQIEMENRFKIYAAFSAVFFYLFLLNQFPGFRKAVILFNTVFASLFAIQSYYQYTPEVASKYSRLMADTYNWPAHQTELCNTSSIESSLNFLVPAYQQGYWKVENAFGGFNQQLQAALLSSNFRPYPFLVQHFLQPGEGTPQLFIEINDFPLYRQHLRDNLVMVLHDESQQLTYLAGTLPKVAGWRRLLTSGTYFGKGFSTTIPLKAVRSGRYRLGCLLQSEDNSPELVMTSQTVSIQQ